MNPKNTGDEVVISGISGLFPKSDNVVEFMDNLYNKVDMVSSSFTDIDNPEVPKYVGKISGMHKFDAQFFRVPYQQVFSLDAMARKLLEQTYGAMFDAGINPRELKGKKVGVYCGFAYQDVSNTSLYEYSAAFQNAFIISGSNGSMFSNRISFWCDLKGPSFRIDSSEVSFTLALERAYIDMKNGGCEAAVVCGSCLSVEPTLFVNIKRTGVLSLDGKTKCFDKKGAGYVRSESVAVLLLQKAKDAKRIYAEVVNIKSNYGTSPDNNFRPQRSAEEYKKFLGEFYSDIDVDPNEVEYVEGQGTALPEADANELEAIGDIFGKKKPVMVGCVKSNMGNSESASGICAVTKLCLAYQKGVLPANLHCEDPLDVNAVKSGKVKLLTDHAHFERGFTAINNISCSGINCHVLMKGFYKSKELDRYKSSIPRLVCVSGRQESSVEKIFNDLKSRDLDPELIGLLHNIHNSDIHGHTCRGYAILDTDEKGSTVSLSQGTELYQGGKRPLWFVYSGMGSQWATMGADLMKIPIFAAAIEKCHKVLEPKGIDLIRILCDPDKKMFDNVLNCFVGITAVQIGLTDILKAINIVPDNIIGHSVGEIGCAYCDGGLSAEETILSSYTRGLVSIQSKFIKGSMAAVGLGFKELQPLCKPEIDIACHNSFESSTISGPADVIKEFVKELQSKDIFVREVPCGNIAYHSRYIKNAAPEFQRGLQEVIKVPAKRSEKWICSSLPEERWNEPLALYSSAEYHANNFMSPVYFEESARKIPQDAILVEIAPHGLLQAILKRSHKNCAHIPLTRRGNSDAVKYLLEAFGKLYQEGFNPIIEMLYPKIEFPVSTETLPMSHFVEWHHEEHWPVILFDNKNKVLRPSREIPISLEDSDYQFITGHNREGNIIFPESAILVTVWEILAMYQGKHYEDMSIAFSSVRFHSQIILDPKKVTKVRFEINKGNGYFEVTNDAVIIANGYISVLETNDQILEAEEIDKFDEVKNADDVYGLLNTRGYFYANDFLSIISTNSKMDTAKVKWNNNWITLLDSLIQLNVLKREHHGMSELKIIQDLKINTCGDKIKTQAETHEPHLIVHIEQYAAVTTCGGIEMSNLIFEDKPMRNVNPIVIQHSSFMPHITDIPMNIEDALLFMLQIVAENEEEDVISVSDLTVGTKFNIAGVIDKISDFIPHIKLKVNDKSNEDLSSHKISQLVVVLNICDNTSIIEELLSKSRFVLSLEKPQDKSSLEGLSGKFQIIATREVADTTLVLLKKQTKEQIKFLPITHDEKFAWISRVLNELTEPYKLVLVFEKKPKCGFKGLVKLLRKKFGTKISFIVLDDITGLDFNYKATELKNQVKKNLFVNILKNGQWGGYYQIPCRKTQVRPEKISVDSNNFDIDMQNGDTEDKINQNNAVQVCFAGISFKDLEKAKIETHKDRFGMDYSGIDEKGQKVMGLIPSGAFASVVESDPELVWPVPNQWTLEEAATVPFPYIYAYYCLIIRRLIICPDIEGRNIFVTDGAEAFGEAVISVGLSMGYTVFTSVSGISQKQYLMKRFPELNENHIGCSCEAGFYSVIAKQTDGLMCALVINTYSGKLREYAMKCVGSFGSFMDISSDDIKNNEPFGMNFLMLGTTYMTANLSSIFQPQFSNTKKILGELLFDGIKRGVVKPISHVLFDFIDVNKALRLLSSDKRKGRFLLQIRDVDGQTKFRDLNPGISCSPNGIYVIICDNSNIGIELANRLVKRGAKNLVVHHQEKEITPYLHTMLEIWRQSRVKVDICSDKLQIDRNCLQFIKDRENANRVHGVFYIKPQVSGFVEEDFIKCGNIATSTINNLDVVSRNDFSSLKYFVVISREPNNLLDEYATSVIENIIQMRSEIGLPALLLRTNLGDKPAEGALNFIDLPSINAMLDALESSLRQNYDNILIHSVTNNSSTTFLKSVSQILGVNVENIEGNLNIGDINSSAIILQELKVLLKDVTTEEFTVENIKDMSISRLKTLKMVPKRNISGLSAFYNYFEKDEIEATNILIPMSTVIQKKVETEFELDSNGAHLILISGFDGNPNVFDLICERLKVRAVTCQLGPDMTTTSIPDIALEIKKFICERLKMKTRFQILGYSFGINIALEVAALLEKDGLVGLVYCLDSSPDALRVHMDAYIGKLSENEMQNAILEHMFYIMSGKSSTPIQLKLKTETSWWEKVEICINDLRRRVTFSVDYQRNVFESAYKRIMLARSYNPDMKLESDIVLIKGIPHPKAESLPDDYNLSRYTTKPVKVFEISSDFVSAPEDCKVSNIINNLLEPEMLEDLKSINLSEDYYTAPVFSF